MSETNDETRSFNGQIKTVRFYGWPPLSPEEIALLAQGGEIRLTPVAYWPPAERIGRNHE